MQLIVTIEAKFVVNVETDDPARAVRAVEANWDSVLKHRAWWYRGIAPQLQDGRIVGIEPLPATTEEGHP